MRKLRSISILLASCVLAFSLGTASCFADSTTIDGEATFNGNEIQSTLDSGEVVKAFNNLQPGDDITVRVKYQNDYSESTDWYMANEVVQTLEKTDAARKTVEGTGTAENGGYTYTIVNTDKNGKETVLFSNDEVGGDAKPNGMEGLEQATNALDDWFYIQTLGKGESGVITMKVAFEGETEVNDYMDTDGEVLLRFAVELTKNGVPDKGPSHQQTRTGDSFLIWPFLLMILSGIVMLLLLLWRRTKDEGGEA